MGAAPSVPQDRSRTLQVIGAGYSRTGTLSMAFALERLLDGPVMHGGSQLLGREDGKHQPNPPLPRPFPYCTSASSLRKTK